jgi:abequosyltransferase
MSGKPTPPSPLLSICIASYNRVDELDRCLRSIDSARVGSLEIVVSEDCSPKRDEISDVVERFVSRTEYAVTYNSNPNNLGFDRNFEKLIQLSRGDYVLFMTDDDAFCKESLDKIMGYLETIECGVAFTPYYIGGDGALDRKFGRTMVIPEGIRSVNRFLFSSILVSGLIFDRRRALSHAATEGRDSIYFQVYLFASLLYRWPGYYIDVPLVRCIGDGENSFGLTDSGEENALLADRSSVCSNLEFHKGLIRAVEMFDEENETDLKRRFAREYSLRAYTGMRSARVAGMSELRNYWTMMKSLDLDLSVLPSLYYWALTLLGHKACDLLFQFPRRFLLGRRKAYVESPIAIS